MPAHRRLMQEAGVAHRLRDNGWIFLYRSDHAFAGSRFARDVYDRFEIATQELDQSALMDLEPHLLTIFPRALWIRTPAGRRSRPGRRGVCRAVPGPGWQPGARDHSTGTGCTGFVAFARAGGSTTTANQVVIALGPWANDLLKPLGVAAPLAFERGYHQHFAGGPGATLGRPVYDTAAGYVLAPMEAACALAPAWN